MVEKKICRARLKDFDDASTPSHPGLSIVRQCELLGLAAFSTCYYQPAGETAENLALMKRIDEQYLQTPFFGSRKIAIELGRQSQACSAFDAADGLGGDLSETAHNAAGCRTQDLPLFTAEYRDHAAQPSVGQRHHVHPATARIFVSRGGDGLVQSLRVGLAVVEHAGGKFLRRSAATRRCRHGRPQIFNSDQGSQFTSHRVHHPIGDRPAWRFRWMAAAERSTTCSSNGCGGA